MKRFFALMLAGLLLLACTACGGENMPPIAGSVRIDIAEQYSTAAPTGSAPAEYSGDALNVHLLLEDAVLMQGGYLSPADTFSTTVIKRDAAGNELWRKSYDFPNKKYARSALFPAGDGFYFACEEESHQLRNGIVN